MHPDHYIGSSRSIDIHDRMSWDNEWDSICFNDTKKQINIKFSMGYSHINSFKDDSLTVTTITTTAPGTHIPVIIYKDKLYDASCVNEIIEFPYYYRNKNQQYQESQ